MDFLSDASLEEGFEYFYVEREDFKAAMRERLHELREDSGICEFWKRARLALWGGEYPDTAAPGAEAEKLYAPLAVRRFSYLFLLTAKEIHRQKSAAHHFREDEDRFSRERIGKRSQSNWYHGHDNIGEEEFLWLAEMMNANQIFCGSMILHRKSPELIHIHIAGKADISHSAMVSNFRMMPKVLEEHFGIMGSFRVHASSWLLSPEVQALLQPGSHILELASFFDCRPAGECLSGLRENVFHVGENVPVTDYPENSSLQRSIKQALLDGTVFHEGAGYLREEYCTKVP